MEWVDWLHRINCLVSPVGGELAICPLLAGLMDAKLGLSQRKFNVKYKTF
jgi:hypothetical protein